MTESQNVPWTGLSGPFLLLAIASAFLWPRETTPVASAPVPTNAAALAQTASASVTRDIESMLGEVWGCVPELCAQRETLQILHVSVADPLDSRSGWLFDDTLEAIQRAVEATGRTLVHFDLPWRAGETEHHRRPGVMVFRGGALPTLLVLLVGELPTTGLHAEALKAALAFEGAWWRRVGHSPPAVRLLMPAFSGSIESLGRALRGADAAGDLPPGAPLRLVTGSATSLPPSPFGGRIGEHVVDFAATVRSDELVLTSLFAEIDAFDASVEREHRRERRRPPARVAVLVEGNTGYGARVTEALRTAGLGATVLPFPLHIARLRSIYDREAPNDLRAERQNARLTAGLRLSLTDDGEFADTPPALSVELTARSNELVLGNLLSAIYRENIRYLGIFATDTRDKLFLATQIRRFCPDVRLFTLEADVLFMHPDYHAYLEGMLVASSYAPPGQSGLFAHAADTRRLEFSSTNVQGTYNATLALLDAPDALFEGYVRDPGDPRRARPLLWISEVARGGFWPRKVLDPVLRVAELQHGERRPELAIHTVTATAVPALVARGAPLSSSLILWLFSLILLFHCEAFWRPNSRVGVLLSFSATEPTPRGWVLCMFSALTLAAAALAIVWVVPQATSDVPRVGLTEGLGWWALAIAVIASMATSVVITVDLIRRRAVEGLHRGPAAVAVLTWVRASRRRSAWVAVLAVALGSLAVRFLPVLVRVVSNVLWPDAPSAVPGAEMIFFHHRATRLLGGLSPLVPITLVAVGLYLSASYNIRENALCRDGVLTVEGGALSRLAMGSDARGLLFGPRVLHVQAPGLMAAIGLIFVALPVGYTYGRFLPTWEGWVFDTTIVVLGGVLLGTVVYGVLRLLAHWRSARELFQALAAHPIGEAISQLPAPVFLSVAALLAQKRLPARIEAIEDELSDSLDAQLPTAPATATARVEGAAGLAEGPADAPGRPAALAYLALAAVRVVRRVVAHIATDLAYLAASFFCLLGAASLYPFQPRRLLFLVVTTFTIAGAATVLWVIVGVERDVLTSRVTRTEAGKVNWSGGLMLRVIAYAVLPLIALVSAQVPELGRAFGLLGDVVTRALP